MHLNGILDSLRHDIISIDSKILGTNKFDASNDVNKHTL